MQAGKLRNKIKLQANTVSLDVEGNATDSWSTAATVSGSIEALSGREALTNAQLNSEVTHKVTIRYYAGLTTKHRILFGSRIFSINSVINPAEKNKELIIMAVESV
jgi:SPP1 family predicted phage head-tail adaptor